MMCRHVAYVGPSLGVDALLFDPPHSLEHQSYAAKELITGVVSADGFGAAWYNERAGDTPTHFRSTLPIWADRSFRSVTGHARAHAVVANVRNATEAGTTSEANVHPFVHETYAFSHNGYLQDFRSSWMRSLREELTDAHYNAIEGVTESETIFRVIMDRVDGGASPRDALLQVTSELLERAREMGKHAQLSFLLTDGGTVWAARASDEEPCASLYAAVNPARFPGGTVFASEPLDDDAAWRPVPHDHLATAHAGEPIQLLSLADHR